MSRRNCTTDCTVSIPISELNGFINVKLKDGKYFAIQLMDEPLYESIVWGQNMILPINKIYEYLNGEKVYWRVDEVHESVLTPFQKKMFETLLNEVSYGVIITYGKLARWLRSSPRGVAMALKYNTCPIVLPCHRVVSKGGIGGFSSGIKWKKYLLSLEGGKL
ncbi:MAG TPA: methylated-DNA--[protein]-cysteine S-methyltransferase [Candidatus Atribacteria bacterium]|nr:methylated-DNA--[protein]-cysteine S-methyltransferase [Candidatus Atribacteria bacterium]